MMMNLYSALVRHWRVPVLSSSHTVTNEISIENEEESTPAANPPLAQGSDVERMLPLVYEELRRIARRQLRHEGIGHTLNTTALVHEAYLRLAAPAHLDISGRAEFLSIAAMAMRRVLIDYARQRTAQKRGGVQVRVELDDIEVAADGPSSSSRSTRRSPGSRPRIRGSRAWSTADSSAA
jgi:hypothetical protein